MKKAISLILSILLVFTLALPAFADGSEDFFEPAIQTEGDFVFELNAAGTDFLHLLYAGEDEICRVPKTVAGITLTPENFNGAVLCEGNYISHFTVDADNAYFSTRDDMLFTKDGKTLLYVADEKCNGICNVPEGTEKLAKYCIYGGRSCCLILPESISEISPEYCYLDYPADIVGLAAQAGSYAETFAKDNKVPFVVMGEGHEHAYFRNITKIPASCDDPSAAEVVCPCGEVIYHADFEPVGHFWDLGFVLTEDGIEMAVYCWNCGKTYSEVYGAEPSEEFMREHFGEDYEWIEDDYYDGEIVYYDCKCACHCREYGEYVVYLDAENEDEGINVIEDLIFGFYSIVEEARYQIYTVRLFFWRMLGIHRYCDCGVRHY